MSLTICKKCGWQISADSAFCPNCGCPKGGSTKKSSTGIAGLVAIGLVIVACVWCKSSPTSRDSTLSTPSSNSSNSTSGSNNSAPFTANSQTSSAPVPYPSQQPPNPKLVDKCSLIESDLASVESDQAGNERALDLYEGMEGSIGQGSYLNALKEKGRLQLRHIELERKLKACSKRR